MALGRTYAVSLVGMNGHVVEVEADIGHPLSSNRHTMDSNRASALCLRFPQVSLHNLTGPGVAPDEVQ
ncbi:hypothetical protein C4K88_01090 [Arthrobacter pityocampae]|uniref:Uncharacterized protein n=1 Tax=Arthrobacter pityocampae TaxID=547334 RepID=A0A2S5J116_9MICC|nr:hypothetical protein C4K88_01090 [Arthrobacter pityocampae]